MISTTKNPSSTNGGEDADSELPKLYEVEVIGEDDDEPPFEDLEQVVDLKESKDLFLFDLAGTLDQRYSDVLVYSDFIIIPFEYSDVSVKSTLVFKNLLGLLESEAERIFIRSKYDKGLQISQPKGNGYRVGKIRNSTRKSRVQEKLPPNHRHEKTHLRAKIRRKEAVRRNYTADQRGQKKLRFNERQKRQKKK